MESDDDDEEEEDDEGEEGEDADEDEWNIFKSKPNVFSAVPFLNYLKGKLLIQKIYNRYYWKYFLLTMRILYFGYVLDCEERWF